MFDFISGQVLNILAARRLGGLETPLADLKRPPDTPVTPVARGATAEDQLLFGSTAYAPAPRIPVKPDEPIAPENRVRDVLRRIRGQQRTTGPLPDPLPDTPPESQDERHLGTRLDLYA
jgi:hypothetical protein